LQDLIRNASRQLNGRIKFRKIYNDEVFLLLEQNGAFGFINLVGQIWFARTFLLYMGPATLTNSHTGPVLFLLTLLYYIITFLWVYYSLLYWVAKYYNLTLPAWVAGANYFLNLFLVPGPILTFSIVALILWLIVKLLNWVSQFEIKKVFIIITIPFLLTGMLFQFLAA
jgi:hypothetical protein